MTFYTPCELSCPLQIKLLQFTFTVIMSFPRRFMHFECKFAHPISCSVHISCTNIRWEPIFLILALGFWILEFGILDFHWQISGVGTQCPWRVWEGRVEPREIGPFAKCLQKLSLLAPDVPEMKRTVPLGFIRGGGVVDRPTWLICISDLYLYVNRQIQKA